MWKTKAWMVDEWGIRQQGSLQKGGSSGYTHATVRDLEALLGSFCHNPVSTVVPKILM